jgi:hypothetical protein
VIRIMKECNNHVLEKNIMRRGQGGPKLTSSLVHTQAKKSTSSKSVFQNRGNQSPISGIAKPPVTSTISVSNTKQIKQHSRKLLDPKKNGVFCNICGKYVASKFVQNILCTHFEKCKNYKSYRKQNESTCIENSSAHHER